MAYRYDSIRELDKERNGWRNIFMTSIENYMVPPPFEEPIVPKMEHIRNYIDTSTRVPNREFVKCANKNNRVRVKNTFTGELIEFDKMINAARFVGTTGANMRCGIGFAVAKMYHVGEREYVFEYDGVERPTRDFSEGRLLDGMVTVVSSTGEKTPFPSYFSVARQLGLLVGHVIEEEKRTMAKKYVLGKETFTLEFRGKERVIDGGRGIVCHWKGIYDGNFEGISGIKVTYGNPIKRDDSY